MTPIAEKTELLLMIHENPKISANEVAAFFGISRNCAYKRMTKAGVSKRSLYLTWTPEMDRVLLEGRAAGMSWRQICKRIKVSDQAATRRYREIYRAPAAPVASDAPPAPRNVRAEYDMGQPLPAGNPISWGAIALDGAPFPGLA